MSGLDPKEVRDLIVRPVLEALDLPSPNAAERLLMGTAAQESGFSHIKQVGGGPALGLWQMEPTTHDDIWSSYLRYRAGLVAKVGVMCGGWPEGSQMLATNLSYAAAMCRIHYYSKSFKLEDSDTLEDLAAAWKVYYNTPKGAGTEAQFIANYKRLVAPIYK